MTNQEPKTPRKPKLPSVKLSRYYIIGLVIMLFGLIVSFLGSAVVGLIILVIGFSIGITGKIYSKRGSTRPTSTNLVETPIERSDAPKQEVVDHPLVTIRCRNCGTTFADTSIKCPNCGAGHS